MSYSDISDMMFDSMMDPSAPQPVLDETPVTLKVHIGNNVTLPCHVRNKGDTQVISPSGPVILTQVLSLNFKPRVRCWKK